MTLLKQEILILCVTLLRHKNGLALPYLMF